MPKPLAPTSPRSPASAEVEPFVLLPQGEQNIVIVGAREHNLRGVDLVLPRGGLTVITGLSGSGKSSLAFDTVYQEGQRRFMESLSAYARQFLGSMEKPRVERIDGLSPTLCIDQKTVNRNPRSTVGTVTEILDHLRLLMARLGAPHCPVCDRALSRTSPGELADRLIRERPEAWITVMAPIVQERKGEYRKELAEALAQGWVRARIDGQLHRIEEAPALARYEKHSIELVVDRLRARPEHRSRLAEAMEQAVARAGGTLSLLLRGPSDEQDEHQIIAMARTCPEHGITAAELEPRLFSFNAPQGACAGCAGLGYLEDFDPSLVLDEDAPVGRCVRLLQGDDDHVPYGMISRSTLQSVAVALGAAPSARLRELTEPQRAGLLEGCAVEILVTRTFEGRSSVTRRPWPGVLPNLREVWRYTHLPRLQPLRRQQPCPECGGARLSALARAVRFRGQSIDRLTELTVAEARGWVEGLVLTEAEARIGAPIVKELRARLGFLSEVGLDYLGLNRSAATLSGGEGQRIRLAGQVGAGLQGVTYVLDEPSIGLHGRDQGRLMVALEALRDKGNTVLVVEHDPLTMRRADWLVEIGPGAGVEGGRLVASAPPAQFLESGALTARFLRGDERIPMPALRRRGDGRALQLKGARENNLQNVNLSVPLGTLTVVTGVSGSGKSTLILQTLTRALAAALHGAEDPPGAHAGLLGVEHLDKVVRIDQDPIGRTPRSNPATYTGAMDVIRDLFAALPDSRARGYTKGRFSFNVAGGRCEECKGAGLVTVELQFLADVEIPCEACGAKRFNAETLELRFRGRTITEVLDLSIAEAAAVFQSHRKLRRIFDTLVEVGLGYVKLGQPSTTLSGGEAQRMKLAAELARPNASPTLYVLDEPTTGLHLSDVRRLIGCLQRLVELGHTVLVVEHDTDIIKCADHVIDLGPDGGAGGGRIVGEGSPEHIATLDTPTAAVLRGVLAQEAAWDARVPLLEEAPTAYTAGSPRVGLGGAAAPLGLPAGAPPVARQISLYGVQTHNLRSVDVQIPEGRLTVITGPSGSGKTSLAFDTLFAEGQRRYVESLSTYARRFLGRMERPPIDRAEGLAPAIAIDQHNRGGNPRSTVATTTEIYDAMRVLYARIGAPHCPSCGHLLRAQPPGAAARALQRSAPGPGWLLAELPPSTLVGELVRSGYQRAWEGPPAGGAAVELDALPGGPEAPMAGRSLVVDRFDPERESTERLSESIADAYRWAGGAAVFVPRAVGAAPIRLARSPRCPTHGAVLPEELTPRHFSFNSHLGACPDCAGLGRRVDIDPALLLPRPEAALGEAIEPGVAALVMRSPRSRALISALLAEAGVPEDTAVGSWPSALRAAILDGSPTPLSVRYSRSWGGGTSTAVEEQAVWPGLRSLAAGWSRAASLRREQRCGACQGARLSPLIRGVTIGEGDDQLAIHEVSALTVDAALARWERLQLSENDAAVAAQPVEDMRAKLRFLRDVGLGYLTLDRPADTLSGGESQRIRLATQLGARLTSTLYVLDEPTIGLHPRDTARLLGTLSGLRDLGNTVVVVEHDLEVVRAADHVIDMGPAAGEHGGLVVDAGTPEALARGPGLTGAFLSGRRRLGWPAVRRPTTRWLQPPLATWHNLEAVAYAVPRGCLTAVTGVSGSGKSSLVLGHFADWLSARGLVTVGRRTEDPADEAGDDAAPKAAPVKRRGRAADAAPDALPARLVIVDQRPIGRSPRSTPATWVGIWDAIRALFAEAPLSRERAYTPGRFSWNTPGGRCEACQGRGSTLVEMHFLSDIWVPCEVCGGRRFARETLEVRWREHSIADVLDLDVASALALFANQRRIRPRLEALVAVGLGYLRLGQAGSTLSGGEAQRLKLANELIASPDETVYLLDEPTNGLHLSDIELLVGVLHRLVDQGHTVVFVEHQTDLILNADHLIDMGPEGGAAGGRVVGVGTPEQLAAMPGSHTGAALAALLASGAAAADPPSAAPAPARPGRRPRARGRP